MWDWQAFGAIGEWAGALAAAAAVIVALWSQGASRREWRRQIALRAAARAKRFEDEIRWVRSPLTSGSEAADRERQKDETWEEASRRDEEHARFSRLQQLHKTLGEVTEIRREAEADAKLVDLSEALRDLDSVFKELSAALQMYFMFARQKYLTEEAAAMQESYFSTVYGKPDDAFAARARQVVAAIETAAAKHLR